MTQDDIKAAQEALKTSFEARAQMSDFQQNLQEAGLSIEQMMHIFEKDSATADFFNMQTSNADKLRLMLAAATDDAQKLRIELAQIGGQAGTDMLAMQMNEGVSQEKAIETTQGVFDRVGALGLDDEQNIELLAKISEADSIDAINEGLKRIEESGNIEDFEVPVKPPTEEELRKQT